MISSRYKDAITKRARSHLAFAFALKQVASYKAQMDTEPILARLLSLQLALNVGKHQRKTSQTLGVNGP